MSAVLNGRYELLERLGAGGTGEVFRARDTRLDRVVAIKLLRSDAQDEASRARMAAEARLAGALDHPCIAQVLDVAETDEDEPRPFIVMQYVEGPTLSRVLRDDGALSPEQAMQVVADIASALGAAHADGVVHRDVKPGNVILEEDGRAVLVDFGIARSQDSEPLTSTGSILGTAHFLSPEQASGRMATPASDIYSLGIVAFSCLMGHPPFARENDVATALAHIQEPLPPLDGVPDRIAELVRSMTAKDPDDRPASAHQVERRAAELAVAPGAWSPTDTEVAADPPTGVLAPPPASASGRGRRPRRAWWLALPVAGLAVAAAILLSTLTGAPTVPSVVGMDVEAAAAVLADADVTARRTLVDAPGSQRGVVVAQSPEPGARQEVVELEVASGKVAVELADIRGSALAEAVSLLSQLGLTVRTQEETTADAERGTVLGIDKAGRLDVGSTVVLTVAVPAPAPAAGTSGGTAGTAGGTSSGGTATEGSTGGSSNGNNAGGNGGNGGNGGGNNGNRGGGNGNGRG